jgi:hypothetical protein
MIKSLASSPHEQRVSALENDISVAVVIHEAGHVLMGNLHGLRLPILLPLIEGEQDVRQIAEHAGTQFSTSGLTDEGITDICFGGYCGELTLYDEASLQSNTAAFWVNADRAAYDCISFVKRGTHNPAAALRITNELNAGGSKASLAVRALFQQYGLLTYRKMRLNRAELIIIAQDLYDFWKANSFKRCTRV